MSSGQRGARSRQGPPAPPSTPRPLLTPPRPPRSRQHSQTEGAPQEGLPSRRRLAPPPPARFGARREIPIPNLGRTLLPAWQPAADNPLLDQQGGCSQSFRERATQRPRMPSARRPAPALPLNLPVSHPLPTTNSAGMTTGMVGRMHRTSCFPLPTFQRTPLLRLPLHCPCPSRWAQLASQAMQTGVLRHWACPAC